MRSPNRTVIFFVDLFSNGDEFAVERDKVLLFYHKIGSFNFSRFQESSEAMYIKRAECSQNTNSRMNTNLRFVNHPAIW